MSYEHPHILYMGNAPLGKTLRATIELDGWHIDLSDDLDEGLALYIVNYPDVVILGGDIGAEIFDYLQPLLSTSPLGIGGLLMLGSAAPQLPNTVAMSLPANAKSDDLVVAVRFLLDAKQEVHHTGDISHTGRLMVFAGTKKAI
jgi:hypothetical protein